MRNIKWIFFDIRSALVDGSEVYNYKEGGCLCVQNFSSI